MGSLDIPLDVHRAICGGLKGKAPDRAVKDGEGCGVEGAFCFSF